MYRVGSKGFSLIGLLTSIAIASVSGLVIANILLTQDRDSKVLRQRMEVVDLRIFLAGHIRDNFDCKVRFQTNAFDLSSVSESVSSPTVLNFTKLQMSELPTSVTIVEAGKPIGTSGVKVSTIEFKDIVATGNDFEYLGYFEIVFDKTSLLIDQPPIRIPLRFNISMDPSIPLSNAKVEGCGSVKRSNIAELRVFNSSTTWKVPTGISEIHVQMWGAGGGGGAGGANPGSGNLRGGGGGGGAYTYAILQVNEGDTFNIVVGTGGAAGVGCGGAGGAGGAWAVHGSAGGICGTR